MDAFDLAATTFELQDPVPLHPESVAAGIAAWLGPELTAGVLLRPVVIVLRGRLGERFDLGDELPCSLDELACALAERHEAHAIAVLAPTADPTAARLAVEAGGRRIERLLRIGDQVERFNGAAEGRLKWLGVAPPVELTMVPSAAWAEA